MTESGQNSRTPHQIPWYLIQVHHYATAL